MEVLVWVPVLKTGTLESGVSALKSRVDHLESRRDGPTFAVERTLAFLRLDQFVQRQRWIEKGSGLFGAYDR